MTSQKWRAMSVAEKNAFIAVATGMWIRGKDVDGADVVRPLGATAKKWPHGVTPANYYADLNACAEMVATLDELPRRDYVRELCGMLETEYCHCAVCLFKLTEATAPQRCEAFALAVEPETGEI